EGVLPVPITSPAPVMDAGFVPLSKSTETMTLADKTQAEAKASAAIRNMDPPQPVDRSAGRIAFRESDQTKLWYQLSGAKVKVDTFGCLLVQVEIGGGGGNWAT